ncbi:MAG: hypothetical protein ACRCYX_11800 [Dermatophilaceae bacterium]
MDISDVVVVAVAIAGLFAAALGAPAVMVRWAARSQALRAEQVLHLVLPGEQVREVAVGRARRPLRFTGALVALGTVAVVAARPLGIAPSAVVAMGVVAALLVTHHRVLVAATATEVVVIETTRDLEPVRIVGRMPLSEWQPTPGWGAASCPIGTIDIVVACAALGHQATTGALQNPVLAIERPGVTVRSA